MAPTDARSQERRLKAAFPLAWLHVPKTGSSLPNFLVHLPGVCPGLPDDLVITRKLDRLGTGVDFIWAAALVLGVLEPDGPCLGHISSWSLHVGAGPDWDAKWEGHGVMMMRQPEQRVISAYNYGYLGWPLLGERNPHDELEFARVLAGCAVRMITRGGVDEGDSCGGGSSGMAAPTEAEVALAIRRVRHGFVFVGLADEWALSICLGHRILGGPCRWSDFIDNRQSAGDVVRSRMSAYLAQRTTVRLRAPVHDTSVLHGFHDPYDGALYAAAQERFRSDLKHYGVSMASCQACFSEAGVIMED